MNAVVDAMWHLGVRHMEIPITPAKVWQVLQEKAVKRKVPLKALSEGTIQPGAKASVKLAITVTRGISQDKGRELNKFIKGLGIKGIQSQTQGDQVRVTGKKRDDLQAVIALVKAQDYDFAVQFTNYR